LSTSSIIVRLAAIGAIVACFAGAFAYVGGWLSPERLTPDRVLAAIQADGEMHPGFRRNHAKGVCAVGWFDSSGKAAAVSEAAVFKAGRSPVIARFSLAGSLPFQPDTPQQIRAMALRVMPPGGEEWRTAMINLPVFVADTVQAFYALAKDSAPDPSTGKPDPAKMQGFMAAFPTSARALDIIGHRSVSSGFGDATYNSLDAFRFVSATGTEAAVRWSVVPVAPDAAGTQAPAAPGDKNYLFDGLIALVAAHPLQWHLMITLAQPGDPTAQATVPWPADRPTIDAGTLTIDRLSAEPDDCDAVVFDPLVLPNGIEASDDPIPSARSAAYARSFTMRAGEQAEKLPSPITPQEVSAGGKS
jgi:catalase